MRVDLFTIGNFTIHTYGLMIAVGIILAVIIAMHRADKLGLVGEEALNLAIICVVIGFLGAKLLFVLENFRSFLQNPLAILGSSGFVVYGGIVIGILAVFIYCRVKKLSFFRYTDLLFPSVVLAQAFGRIGCFFAGCCYCKETDAWWGVIFPEGSFAPAGVALIPTQLISSAGDFLICILLLLFSKRAKKVGDVSAMYLLLYGIGRFGVEYLRENTQGGIGMFTTAQIFSFVFVGISIILFIRNRVSRYSEDYSEKVYSIWM